MSTTTMTVPAEEEGWIEVKAPKRQQQKLKPTSQRSNEGGSARRGPRRGDGERPSRRNADGAEEKLPRRNADSAEGRRAHRSADSAEDGLPRSEAHSPEDRLARRNADGAEGRPRRNGEGAERRRERREGGSARNRDSRKAEAATEKPVEVATVIEAPAAEDPSSEAVQVEATKPAATPARVPLPVVMPGGRSWAVVAKSSQEVAKEDAPKVHKVEAPKTLRAPKASKSEVSPKAPKVEVSKANEFVEEKPAAKETASETTAVPAVEPTSETPMVGARAWAGFRQRGAATAISTPTTPTPEGSKEVDQQNRTAAVAAAGFEETPAPAKQAETEPFTPATTAPSMTEASLATKDPEPSDAAVAITNESTPAEVAAPTATPDKKTQPQLQPQAPMQQLQQPHTAQLKQQPSMTEPPMVYGYPAANVTMPQPFAAYMPDYSAHAKMWEEEYYNNNPQQRARGWKPHITHFYPSYFENPYLARWHATMNQTLQPNEEAELQRVLTQPAFGYGYYPQYPTMPPHAIAPMASAGYNQRRHQQQHPMPMPPMSHDAMSPRGYYPPASGLIAPQHLQQRLMHHVPQQQQHRHDM